MQFNMSDNYFVYAIIMENSKKCRVVVGVLVVDVADVVVVVQ